jgi:Spy/CpxP family protein refolding chaperone
MIGWWKSRHGGDCGGEAHCGEGGGWGHHRERGRWGYEASHDDAGGGAFGVRRPLRFLAYKLELDEKQVGELAKVLSDLKTERAQADVDGRRTVAGFADAVGGAAFDDAKAKEAAELRVKSAGKLRDAVVTALSKIHAILNEEQRAKLAYLIRTGTISI